MGELISFSDRTRRGPVPERDEGTEQQIRELERSFEHLTIDDAIEGVEPYNEERTEQARSFQPSTARMIAAFELTQDAAQRGQTLDERHVQALAGLGGFTYDKMSAISIPVPGTREQVRHLSELRNERRERLADILTDHVDEETCDRLKDLQAEFVREWDSPEWTAEREVIKRELLDQIHAELRSPSELIGAAEGIERMFGVSDERGVASLADMRRKVSRLKDLKAAEEAFATGDPTTIKGHGNRELEWIADSQRRKKDIFLKRYAAALRDWYRGKVRSYLRERNLLVLDT